jgi:exosortase
MTTMALVLVGLAFAALFARPAALLVQDWWNDPEAGHGLLLAPAALWLAWRRGLVPDRTPNPALGLGIVGAAVAFRLAAELAAEFFVMRGAMVLGLAGLVVYYLGFRQARAWWLPIMLLALSVPLPELIRSSLALPLQFKASELGASLLDWRHVPVRLAGNVIQIPGHRLFVTEACSGLRSLTALLSLALLIGGIWFRRPALRVTLILLTIPIAVGINGIRVFLTGFLVYFVDPKLGEGFMHLTEGWLLFVVSFALVGVVAAGLSVVDRWWTARRKVESPA